MESTLFTALSTNEEANLSGGGYRSFNVSDNNVVIVKQYASAKAYGFYPSAYASNYSNVSIEK
ncbi:hypothetical protein CDG76_10870 [Nostoc sp. 'Peltigera membranacea cyanobiont' 210A]|uniref:hypothetical protein n=1 Tax=Nostoc sp. 'Peltigera membranacea cyanobiont' 210A TaxID=2014529 RepID=UPI000B9596FB|nr:hypothetical protein [Nostoc sp. 'Peltigera membranacea cyanobiont' 210A]OYD95452.1 hypothetical protein CDG76_10870 [Nostoc sp. 'Peltigera membranacea cyanobiont' 210A]